MKIPETNGSGARRRRMQMPLSYTGTAHVRNNSAQTRKSSPLCRVRMAGEQVISAAADNVAGTNALLIDVNM